jgi:hypothetical protein
MWGDETKTYEIFAETVKTYTLTINPNPASATVTMNGSETKSITVPENSNVSWRVEKEGYIAQSGNWTATKNDALNITLVSDAVTPTNYTFTITPNPTSATVTLSATGYSTVSGTGSKSITVANGTTVNWRVEASGYTTRTGNWTISGGNKTENITLDKESSGEEPETPTNYTFTIEPDPSTATVTVPPSPKSNVIAYT